MRNTSEHARFLRLKKGKKRKGGKKLLFIDGELSWGKNRGHRPEEFLRSISLPGRRTKKRSTYLRQAEKKGHGRAHLCAGKKRKKGTLSSYCIRSGKKSDLKPRSLLKERRIRASKWKGYRGTLHLQNDDLDFSVKRGKKGEGHVSSTKICVRASRSLAKRKKDWLERRGSLQIRIPLRLSLGRGGEKKSPRASYHQAPNEWEGGRAPP